MVERVKTSAAGSPMSPELLVDIGIGTAVLTFVIQLLLWFFVARKGSDIARWIYVILFGLGLLGTLLNVMRGTWLDGIPGVVAAVCVLLQVAAVVMLFRPDSNTWFTRKREA